MIIYSVSLTAKYVEHTLTSTTEKISAEWEFFEDLHKLWRELPNYNPVGVSSSEHGQDHAATAAALFQRRSSPTRNDHQTTSSTSSQSPAPGEDDGDAGSGIEDATFNNLVADVLGEKSAVTSASGSGWEGDDDVDKDTSILVCGPS